MPSAKLTSKGQITIPREVRRALGAHRGPPGVSPAREWLCDGCSEAADEVQGRPVVALLHFPRAPQALQALVP